MRRENAVAVAAVLALLARASAQDPLRMHAAAGVRYDVSSQLGADDAADRLALLESAWSQLVRFFGREPKAEGGKFQVRVFANDKAYAAGLAEAGAAPGPEHLATYCATTRIVFVNVSWGKPWVRRRMLEECVAQFLAALTLHKNRMPVWCSRGIALHLSSHAWDGQRVELGVVQGVSLENDAAAVLQRVEEKKFDYRELLDSWRREDAVVHAEVVRLLATDAAYRRKFQSLLPRLEKGMKLGESEWSAHFGAYEKFEQALRESVADAQQAFVVGHLEWDTARVERDPDTRSRVFDLRCVAGGVVSACRIAKPARSLRANVQIPADGKRVGVLLDWLGVDDYRVLLIRRDGVYEVQQRGKDAWQQLASGPALAPGQKPGVLALAIEAATGADGEPAARVFLDERELCVVAVRNGLFGLAADSGTAVFRDVRIQP